MTVLLSPEASAVKDRLTAEWPAGRLISAALIVFDRLDYLTQRQAIRAATKGEPLDTEKLEADFRRQIQRVLEDLPTGRRTKRAGRKAT